MSNFVLVIDAQKQPLNPVHPGQARRLLKAGIAAVFRRFPFVIILKQSCSVLSALKTLELKIAPGSTTTGLALLQDKKVVFAAQLTHRGQAIRAKLETRRNQRMSRRSRHTRYRQPRFLNRTRRQGWLAPSLQHRVETTITWVNKLIRFAPIGSIVQELVKFELQKLENPEISGIEYQQGELQGYEVREYMLAKWERKCAECGIENVPLQVEHIHPKSKGGSNRISNLCLACEKCNIKKGTQSIEQFLAKKPDVLKRVLSQAKCPLKDAAAVNSTRWTLFNRLKETLLITSTGRGTRRRCRIDKFGFPCSKPRQNYDIGWQTGDIAMTVKDGVKYVGKVVVQSEKRLEVRTGKLRIGGTLDKFVKLHSQDGYQYAKIDST
jgi:5-methylcytosine-specific restriction endonuclease McrA